MKKSVSKFTRTGFTCLALLAGAAAMSAEVQTATTATAGTAKAKKLSAQAKALQKRMAKVYKPSVNAKNRRDLIDFLNGGLLVGSGSFRPALLPEGIIPAATTAVSGTLTATGSYNYSTAPWVITNGTGSAYPDGGGVATLNSVISPTPGTILGGSAITVDVSPDLSGITYNSVFTYNFVAGTTGATIVADAAAGLTLNAQLTAANSPTLFSLTNTLSAPISGGGTIGVIKTGSGIVTLSGANTFTGGTHINGGELVVSATTAAAGDAVFGATGTGNGISFNGGSLFNNITGGLITSRDIFLDSGGGLFYLNTAATLNGVISGPGSLNDYGFAAVAMTLTNTNTYTGATITSSSTVSALTLNGNGSVATSSSYDLAGTLTIDNSGTSNNNRLSDTAPIAMRGVTVNVTGNATTATAETVGPITLADGVNLINVVPGTAGTTLTTASVTRQNNSTLFVRGTGLGGTPGASVANIVATTAPTLIGGGGAAGSTNISIVPYAIGNVAAATAANSSLVTYAPTTGFRPLATTEYAASLGLSATDNVRITAASAAPTGGSTANALVIAVASTTALTGTATDTINITSGAFLLSATATGAATVSAPLNFGAAEAVISNASTATLTLSGAISGTGGLTSNPVVGGTTTLSGANTYTGKTTLLSGITQYSGTISVDGTASSLGAGTSANSPIVYNPGTATTRLWATAASVFNRDISVIGTGPAVADFGTSGTTYTVTMNGNISLARNLSFDGGTTTAGAMIVNGIISGTGIIGDLSGSYQIFNNANTYTGGTNIATGTYQAGNDAAFGTGTIFFSGAGQILGAGTTARTIGNPLFLSANPTFGGTAPLTFTGGVNINGSRTITPSNTALTAFNGVLANGAITKGGAGAVAFNSATGNTFTGGFVNTGAAATASVIYANNTSGSAFGTGAVSVGAASATVFSTLAGSFTTSGATSIGGRLSPGNTSTGATPALTPATAGIGAIGTMNFGSTLTFSSATNSSLYLEIASASMNDKINVTGLLTLAGTVSIATTNGYTIQAGNTFDFLDFASETGTVTFDTTNASLASGVTLDTSKFYIDGTITAMGTVPEPATVLGGVFTAGLLGLGVRRRMRALAVKRAA